MKRWAVTAMLAVAIASCSVRAPAAGGSSKLVVVAAENVWGSIASQIGGDRVAVTNLIDNPNTDPHDYEPTAADARSIASAQVVIENGIGYDPWAQRLLDADPAPGRTVLNVGTLVGVREGGNPHQWYSPASVRAVIDAVTHAYEELRPASRANFEQQRAAFLNVALKPYFEVLSQIKQRYAGTPVGASEGIFEPMAAALGLDLLTPPDFLKAISQGTDPTAADKAAIDRQIRTHAIEVYVYNSQNATPDVQRQVDAAKAKGVATTTITETPVPAGASFQQWQTAQLRALAAALAQATGR